MDITTFHYSDHIPYPPVKVDGKNPQYAAAILPILFLQLRDDRSQPLLL